MASYNKSRKGKGWKKTSIVLPRSGEKADVFQKENYKIYLAKGHPNSIEPFTKKGWYVDFRTLHKGSEISDGWSFFEEKADAVKYAKKYMEKH